MARLGSIWADGVWDVAIWDADIWAPVTAPTFVSAQLAFDGDSISITFDRVVSIGAGGNGGFTVSASGGAATLTYSSGDGTTTLVYTTSRSIAVTETITLSYTQPGNGVEDAQGNDLESFSGETVTTGSSKPWKSADLTHNRSNLRHLDRTRRHNRLTVRHNS